MVQCISLAVAVEHAVPLLSIRSPLCCVPSCMLMKLMYFYLLCGSVCAVAAVNSKVVCGNTVNVSLCNLQTVVNYMTHAIHLEIHVMSHGYSDFLTALHMMPHATRLVLILNVVRTSQLM